MNDHSKNLPEDEGLACSGKGGDAMASLLRLHREGKVPGDLVRYFAGDFFHDGQIKSLVFLENFKRVELLISSPNIQRGGKFVDPIWFKCTFGDVCKFTMETERIDESNDPLLDPSATTRFLECKIHTLKNDIAKFGAMYGLDFSSVVLKTLPVSRLIGWLFTTLSVEPIEPCAFELMKADDSFIIPTAEL